MKFDFKKFYEDIYSEFKEFLSESEVKELLNLTEEYDKDNPISIGKQLTINRVRILGEKEISENQTYSGAKIDFTIPFFKGINIIIADNLKGKSSVFKIIKYALTGSNSLKENIKKWINYAFVNFSINDKKYTVFLDLSKYKIYVALYNNEYSSISDLEKSEEMKIFDANSERDFQEQINDFFFKQFTYYSLKWTQKSSQKDKDELLEAGASWKTYFKSILLESKDSNQLMYGDQGKKIFQMLIGLQLTYPINRLSIKKDLLNFDKAKEQSFNEYQKQQKQVNLKKIQKRLDEIDVDLINIKKSNAEKINLSPLFEEYKIVSEKIKTESKNQFDLRETIRRKNNEVSLIKAKQNSNNIEINRLKKEIEKTRKQNNDLKEFIEIDVLFSNLDIKQCPSCNHEINEKKKQSRLNEHKCSLCDDSIDDNDNEIDIEIFKEKIGNLENVIVKLENEVYELTDINTELQKKIDSFNSDLSHCEQTLRTMNDISSLYSRIQELEKLINDEKSKINPSDNKIEELVSERAVLNFQIQENTIEEKEKITNYDVKIELLNFAIKKLSESRYDLGKKVLERLSELMKNEIRSFGLTSITEVVIKENFEILYKQDNDYVTFENIAEGEQLRAKIAFYLSLIQLDIEFNFGRHTRLLIIDSPGKEEGDSKYLEGLSTVLKSIESRFGNDLQIIIGTAERRFSGVVKNQKEFAIDEYVF